MIQAVQPNGPYALGGFSMGGVIAFEMARQWAAQGESLEMLALIDSGLEERCLPWRHRVVPIASRLLHKVWNLVAQPPSTMTTYIRQRSVAALTRIRARRRGKLTVDETADLAAFPPALRQVREALMAAMRSYRPSRYPGRVTFFRAATPRGVDPLPAWRQLAQGSLQVIVVEGDHDTMLREPQVRSLPTALDQCLAQLENAGT